MLFVVDCLFVWFILDGIIDCGYSYYFLLWIFFVLVVFFFVLIFYFILID